MNKTPERAAEVAPSVKLTSDKIVNIILALGNGRLPNDESLLQPESLHKTVSCILRGMTTLHKAGIQWWETVTQWDFKPLENGMNHRFRRAISLGTQAEHGLARPQDANCSERDWEATAKVVWQTMGIIVSSPASFSHLLRL